MSVDKPLIARPHPRLAVMSPNPRRRPAYSSVSLRHTASAKANSQAHTASSLVNNNGSPATSSNSQTWFDTSNNNPVLRRTSPIDHEPPFFLPDSSSGTPHIKRNTPQGEHSASNNLFTGGPLRRDAVEGTMDDFRSVIDDLTVQNKKLLKKLRRYERSNTDHPHSERLFEVKFHGLSAAEKHELEETLKRFAIGLTDKSLQESSRHANAATASSYANVPKPSSSLTSTKFADSGYGSMTVSNRPLTHRSSSSMPAVPAGQSGAEASRARERNIHSYLHDIPEGLLPRDSPLVMTEDAKKRLVVARLEQLFNGSGAAESGHQQPIQQQEVSQSAARDDRSAMEARGQRARAEGSREARIMDDNVNASVTTAPIRKSDPSISHTGPSSTSSGADMDSEQRPTRPLDLDPHRAQDPLENVGYIKHLGFQMQDLSPHAQVEDSQGWIYLNLLVNMAQLHTLNVTTNLITDALRSYSSKFELSKDYRKIRWNPTRAPNASGLTQEQLSEDAATVSRGLSVSGLKRSRPVHFDTSSSQHESNPRKKRSASRAASSGLSYTPVWPSSSDRNNRIDEDDWGAGSGSGSGGGRGSEESLPSIAEYPEDSPLNPLDAVVSRSTVSQDDGALIFLSNQRFFMDLSGNRTGQTSPWPRGSALSKSINPRPLGSCTPQELAKDGVMDTAALPLYAASESGSLEVHADEASQSKDIHSSEEMPGQRVESSPAVIPLEASGLGHVRPSDNFVLFVTRDAGPSTTLKDMQANDRVSPTKQPADLLRLISVKQRSLSPSKLPSPTYAVTPDDDEDEDESMICDGQDIEVSSSEDESSSESSDESSVESGSRVNSQYASHSMPDQSSPDSLSRNASSSKRTLDEEHAAAAAADDDDDDQEDAQSLDFLATARAADPAAIQAREREYDAELAERLAEEIPAGSSAATCGGGGSGYNSPATGIRRRLSRKGAIAVDDAGIGSEVGDDGSVLS